MAVCCALTHQRH